MRGLSVSSRCARIVIDDSYFLGSMKAPRVQRMTTIENDSFAILFRRRKRFAMSRTENCAGYAKEHPFFLLIVGRSGDAQHCAIVIPKRIWPRRLSFRLFRGGKK